MNNDNKEFPLDDNWLDDILAPSDLGDEIGADESAVSSAGLTHPEDAELEKIIRQTQEDESTGAESCEDTSDDSETAGSSETAVGLPTDTDMIYEAPPAPKQEAEKADPEQPEDKRMRKKEKKRRPGMKKGYGFFAIPHLLATVIWMAVAVAIGVSLGRMVWVCAADVLAFGKKEMTASITITDTDDLETISQKLTDAGVIRYPELFKMYGELTDAMDEISVGTFTLSGSLDYHALVNSMNTYSSSRETIELMIPEGYTCAQIFQLLEEKNVCSVAELEEYSANGYIAERWFLEGITRGEKYCLEGYLFPDTYEFYIDDEPGRVLGKFLDNFDTRFTDIMKDKIEPLNERLAKVLSKRGYSEQYIEEHKITIREVVIIASMIEKESATNSESYDISSVIYNRLTHPSEHPFLNIDATLIYALDGNIDPETGETKLLTNEDKQIDSPYNTYMYKGLIPGPISNPGRNSLNAALDPSETDYYYYALNPETNQHKFSKTYKEHLKFLDSLE